MSNTATRNILQEFDDNFYNQTETDLENVFEPSMLPPPVLERTSPPVFEAGIPPPRVLHINDRHIHPILQRTFEITETIYEDWEFAQRNRSLFPANFYNNLLQELGNIRKDIENYFDEGYCPWGKELLCEILEDYLTSTDLQFLEYIIKSYYDLTYSIETISRQDN